MTTLIGLTMGTNWSVRCAIPPDRNPAPLQTAIEARLDALVAQFSHWDASSALCRFNTAAPGATVALPHDLAAVIRLSLRVAHAGGGAFDPAIGRLVDLWGFGPPGPRPAPNAARVHEALAVSGWKQLKWDDARARLRQPGGLALDLSGVAKGYAVDAIADLLALHGVDNCLVEIGGELVGRGLKPDGDPWWVDLEPPPSLDAPSLRLALHRCAVATSGDYRRGEHTIDPRNGYPVTNGVTSVSVIAESAALADALATTITVAYPDDSLINTLGVAARIVVRSRGVVRELLTPALLKMLE